MSSSAAARAAVPGMAGCGFARGIPASAGTSRLGTGAEAAGRAACAAGAGAIARGGVAGDVTGAGAPAADESAATAGTATGDAARTGALSAISALEATGASLKRGTDSAATTVATGAATSAAVAPRPADSDGRSASDTGTARPDGAAATGALPARTFSAVTGDDASASPPALVANGRAGSTDPGIRTGMPGSKLSSGRAALAKGPVKKVSESSVCGTDGREGALLCRAEGVTDGACGAETAATEGCSTEGAGKALAKADNGPACGDGGVVVRSNASAPLLDNGRAGRAISGAASGAEKSGNLTTDAGSRTAASPERSSGRSPAPTENSGKASAATTITVPGNARDHSIRPGVIGPVARIPKASIVRPCEREDREWIPGCSAAACDNWLTPQAGKYGAAR